MYEIENDGQFSFYPISTNETNLVVQSNNLITARQNLTLNEAKLIRIIIMQIVAQDVEFKPYEVSISEFSKLIGNEDGSNMYRRAKDFTDRLQTKKVSFHSSDGSWQSIVWTPTCSYNSKTKKIQIRLNDDLKPYLLNLIEAGFYTQYPLGIALSFSSVHALRMYELITSKMPYKILPKNGTSIYLSVQEIRDACMLFKTDKKGNLTQEPKFEKISQLKERVLNIAVREIENLTSFRIEYSDVKEGKSIVGFNFKLFR